MAAKGSWVRWLLGGLWILDGLLQLQPLMFTMSMIAAVLVPVQSGEPRWLVHWIDLVIGFGSAHLVVFNLGIAAVQIGVGMAILLAGDRTAPYIASLAWALAVWVGGQAFGSVLSGQATLWQGAPGSAVLYGLLTWAAWPGQTAARRRHVAWALVGLWVLGAGLQLQPSFWTRAGMAGQFLQNTGGQPVWLQKALVATGAALGDRPRTSAVALSLLQVLVALAVALPASRRVGLAATVVLAAAAWVLGQAFGMLWTGMATDPNSAPLLAALAVYAWPGPARRAAAEAIEPLQSAEARLLHLVRGGRS